MAMEFKSGVCMTFKNDMTRSKELKVELDQRRDKIRLKGKWS